MDWKDIAGTIAKNAPVLGGLLGGPIGLAVDAAGNIVASALGVEPNADAVQAALMSDPEAYVKLRQAEMDHQKDLITLQNQALQLQLADVQSARARQIANPKDHTTTILAYAIIGAFVSMVATMLFGWSHADSALAGTLIGYLSAKAEQVIAYYFGSSKDSAAKTQMISDVGIAAAAAPVNVTTPPPTVVQQTTQPDPAYRNP